MPDISLIFYISNSKIGASVKNLTLFSYNLYKIVTSEFNFQQINQINQYVISVFTKKNEDLLFYEIANN